MKNTFYCSECDYMSHGWLGLCPSCKSWNTFSNMKKENSKKSSAYKKLSDVKADKNVCIPTQISEFDRVLGGGIFKGSLILLSGEPGAGKSTLILTILKSLREKKVFYVSGEESPDQIKLRYDRIGCETDKIFLTQETDYKEIIKMADEIKPDLLIIDSIQTLKSIEAKGLGPGLIKDITKELLEYSNKSGVIIILIGHITKSGQVAGPKYIEHMVDVTLKLEIDNVENYRLLSSTKNRYGSTGEVGIFHLCQTGFKEVSNNKKPRDSSLIGKTYAASIKGRRILSFEVQSLIVKNNSGSSLNVTGPYEQKRLEMLIAIIEKYLKYNFTNKSVFINIVGNKSYVSEHSDLSVIASIISSFRNIKIPSNYKFLGEVGLTGEVRENTMKLNNLNKYDQIVTSIDNVPNQSYNLINCRNINELHKLVLNL